MGLCLHVVESSREKSEYPEDMVKTNIVMPPRKRVQGITINEGGSNPPKKGRQEPPPGDKGKDMRALLRQRRPW